ncbi:hypothetical protein HOG98_07820 [bacterium]|nr:hypothetical protein [bacterium]
MFGGKLSSNRPRLVSVVRKSTSSIPKANLSSNELNHFNRSTSKFISKSFLLPNRTKAYLSLEAKTKYENFEMSTSILPETQNKLKSELLKESIESFEKQDLGILDLSLYSGSGMKMNPNSILWHFNQGMEPFFPGKP